MSQPPPEPRTDGQQPAVERGGLWGLLFSTAGLVVPVYGILLSIIGILQGRRARRNAREQEAEAPGAVMSMVLGWVGIVVWATVIAGGTLIQEELQAWSECVDRANTVTVEQQCNDQLRAELEARGVPGPVISLILD